MSERERGEIGHVGAGFFGGNARWKIFVGFLIAGLLVYLLTMVVGWGQVLSALENADLTWFWIACLSTLVGLVAWSKSWHVVLDAIGIEVPFHDLIVTYFAATFANYITPLGQAGGEPFIAYVLSRDTPASYEDSLASVVTADLLNLLPFFNFAAFGLGFLLLKAELPGTAKTIAVGLVALSVGLPLVIYIGWHYRVAVEKAVLRLIGPIERRTDRVSVANVKERIDRFYGSLDRISTRPHALMYAVIFAYTGWVFFALPLYFAGRTLGLPVELYLVFFIVPASTIAGMTPLPGGLGGVEVAIVVLLIALTAISDGGATALALIYRVASYWFALAVGGIAAMWVTMRS